MGIGKSLLLTSMVLTGIAWSAPSPARAVGPLVLHQATTRATLSLRVPEKLDYRIFTLTRPDRVVLDLHNAQLGRGRALPTPQGPLITGLRKAIRFHGRGERIVLDLRTPVRVRSLINRSPGATPMLTITFTPRTQNAQPVLREQTARPIRLRDVVVAIDPGHGGRDTGAIGANGLREKNITLAIARRLYTLLKKIPGIRPVLTRTGNYYVSLAQRRRIARRDHADLFVSIHADASPYHYPKGSTVYVLSEHGASSVAARILATRENSVDRVAGVNLAAEQPMIASTILKLSQRGTIAQSLILARGILNAVSPVVPLHSDGVERAAFVVLKSPDIPSILIETAFISNRREERQLASTRFRFHLAAAIARGLVRYIKRYAPPGTLLAARRNAINALQQG